MYELTVQPRGGEAQVSTAPYPAATKTITWFGLVSLNETHSVFYMDNIELSVEAEKEKRMNAPFADFVMRGNLMRSFRRFSAGGTARVAFMGGSVTTRGWRIPVMEYLQETFPDTEFDFIMAGIGGTNADLGAFRFPSQVCHRGKVDLFFLEFAVNGGGVRAMEGIVRQAKVLNPNIDIALMYFASKGHTKSFESGKVPGIVQTHEKVGEHYLLPALYLYREIAQRIKAGKITWEDFSGDSVHPNDNGCDMYAECVIDFLASSWQDSSLASPPTAAKLVERLDPLCYKNGRFLPLSAARVTNGFTIAPKWNPKKTCNFRGPVEVLETTKAGAELVLPFEGRAVGVYSIVGMDTGIIEYSIDGAPAKTLDPFDHYCPRFHRPNHTIFVDDLPQGAHALTIRSSQKKNEKSEGHAIRILKFMVN